jgi:hypothetical protein
LKRNTPQVQAEQKLSKIKKEGGDDCANPNIPPGDIRMGQHFEEHGEQQRDDAERDHEIDLYFLARYCFQWRDSNLHRPNIFAMMKITMAPKRPPPPKR